ncbi:MAG: dependent oxidoreductase [Pseudonocardiales bacterium]|jgi:2-polyprenyl-6-methoxyphenol hydroxylase-like FAD-dependent oxidoreductase|nr:dependent oxidoreductase [Pseudonocardiales bacterium]
MSTDIEQADVVIVGARCAGTAAAVPLARAGHKVIVIDKAKFPADTMSTHVLVPNGVQELQFMGALQKILALNPSRSRYLTLHDDDGLEVKERFTPFSGIDYGLCVPRDQQDVLLVESARDAGADVRERTGMTEVVWRDGRAAGVRCKTREAEYEIQAKLVIGADGRKSRVAAEVDAWTPYRASKNGRGFAFRYVDDPRGEDAPSAFQIFRAHGNQVLVLPSCPAGRTLVVNMTDAAKIPGIRADPDASWQEMLDLDPALDDRIGDATNLSRLIATDNLSAYYRRSSGPAWALAGDAGHFKDPVTGNGMRDALKFGRLLGEAAAVTVHDPAELDLALRDWEAARDADTISTYHWGNRESRPGPSTPLVREVLRTFSGNDAPNLSDTFNRARPVEAIITPGRMLKGLVNALRAPDADRRSILREVVAELPAEIGARRHRLLDGFRSTRSAGTERDGWDVGSGQPPSWRPAAIADDDRATPLAGAAQSAAL